MVNINGISMVLPSIYVYPWMFHKYLNVKKYQDTFKKLDFDVKQHTFQVFPTGPTNQHRHIEKL